MDARLPARADHQHHFVLLLQCGPQRKKKKNVSNQRNNSTSPKMMYLSAGVLLLLTAFGEGRIEPRVAPADATRAPKIHPHRLVHRHVGGPNVSVWIEHVSPLPFLEVANITLGWAVGPKEDTTHDWISLWWEPFAATYISFVPVTARSGTFTMPTVANGRHPFIARYFRGNDILAESPNRVVPEGAHPTQLRLTLPKGWSGGNCSNVASSHELSPPPPVPATSLWVSWTTNVSATVEQPTYVYYGTSPTKLHMKVTVTESTTFTREELNQRVKLPPIAPATMFSDISDHTIRCGYRCYNDSTCAALWVHPGYFHNALLEGLVPGQRYYYRVGVVPNDTVLTSFPVRTFRMPPSPFVGHAPGASEVVASDAHHHQHRHGHGHEDTRVLTASDTISVLYVADAGIGTPNQFQQGGATHNDPPANGANKVWEALLHNDPLIHHDVAALFNGDLSYARGWPWIWEVFFSQVSHGFLDAIPTVYSYGNHEFDWSGAFYYTDGPDSGGEAGLVGSKRFLMDMETPWYVQRYGAMTVLALSSEHAIVSQIPFLQRELAAINRTLTPWVVVMIHRPLYASNHFNHDALHMEYLLFAEVFNEYQVTAVLTGHQHYYERLCHVSNDVCTDQRGFVDLWKVYPKQVVAPDATCFLTNATIYSINYIGCRSACAEMLEGPSTIANCTGFSYDSELQQCFFFYCPSMDDVPLQPSVTAETEFITRKPGQAPIYIVDGTAGAEPFPSWTPQTNLTEYKDFFQWGYSRMFINHTTWQWVHYHKDGTVVDSVTLQAAP